MEEITLNDIRPEDCQVCIGGEDFTLRKFNLEDEAWLRSEFKSGTIFTDKMTDEQVCKIAFHQLSLDDKRKFAPVDVTFINDETGEESKAKVGGWRLFRLKISGMNEKVELFKAILATVGISRPMLDKIITDEEKKILNLESSKEVKKKKRTGHKS